MEHTPEEICNALTVLKETCKAARTCNNCPLVIEDGLCGLQHIVAWDWDIKTPGAWRAF